jgi:hypothetical protein
VTGLIQAIALGFPARSLHINGGRQLVLLTLAVLFVALLRATYGLDLSWGFF